MLDFFKNSPSLKAFIAQLMAVASAFSLTTVVEKCQQKAEDHLHEYSYLRQIHADLEKDTASTMAHIRELETVRWRSTRVLTGVNARQISDSLNAYVGALQYSGEFDADDVAYSEMISSGKLALIHDDSLLNQVCAYYKFVEKDLERINESDRRFAAEKVEPFVMERLPVALNGYDALKGKQKQSVIYMLSGSSSLRSLLQANLGRKTAKQAAYMQALERQKSLMASLDKSLVIGK